MLTIVVAGATGFIGQWFLETYHTKYRIIALSRKTVKNEKRENIEWRKVDLYSYSSTASALKGADIAFYFIHSMNASTRLNQTRFEDTDLLISDNFARAAASNHLRQIVYLGGILPKEKEHKISHHLQSRLEVEENLAAYRTPLTTIRAGIIIGPGGSSWKIMKNLVEKLPVMITPRWTRSETQPIAVRDMLDILDEVADNQRLFHKTIEVGSRDILSYREMLRRLASIMGKKRLLLNVPFFSIELSKRWVSLFTESKAYLVTPLVESLKHTMVADDSGKKLLQKSQYESFDDMVIFALEQQPLKLELQQVKFQNSVRSIQRIRNSYHFSIAEVAKKYFNWLPKLSLNMIRTKVEDHRIEIRLLLLKRPLLVFHHMVSRGMGFREIYFIKGGILARRFDFGWLEFRSVKNNTYFLSSIHEYVPRLPWLLYISTQAIIHKWVMWQFGKYVNRKQI